MDVESRQAASARDYAFVSPIIAHKIANRIRISIVRQAVSARYNSALISLIIAHRRPFRARNNSCEPCVRQQYRRCSWQVVVGLWCSTFLVFRGSKTLTVSCLRPKVGLWIADLLITHLNCRSCRQQRHTRLLLQMTAHTYLSTARRQM